MPFGGKLERRHCAATIEKFGPFDELFCCAESLEQRRAALAYAISKLDGQRARKSRTGERTDNFAIRKRAGIERF